MSASCDASSAHSRRWVESRELLESAVSWWRTGGDLARWERSAVLRDRWPDDIRDRLPDDSLNSRRRKAQNAAVAERIQHAMQLDRRADALADRRSDARVSAATRDALDKNIARHRSAADAAWATLAPVFDDGLELRRDSFVTDMCGGALYRVLCERVKPTGKLLVCVSCDRVFEPTRKRSLRSPKCPRCHKGVRVPPRDRPPAERRRSPVFDAAHALAGWERHEARKCACGREFMVVMNPRGGAPRNKCYGCDKNRAGQVYAFVSNSGTPLASVSFARTDGTAIRLDAENGVITTVDAEDALGILRWMPGLRRF